jgi:putative transposase
MLFGNIRYGAVVMNEVGRIVQEEWEKSAEIRPSIELDAYVVMPNHLHGLVTIVPDDFRANGGNTSGLEDKGPIDAPLRQKPRSLGSFVGGFKGATTARINTLRGTAGTPVWQRNYY